MRLIIQVPCEPVPKGRPRVTRFGTHTPARTRAFEKQIRQAMQDAVAASDWPTDKEYHLRIAVYRARRAGDAIGYGCSVQDAGNGVVWDDDRQIQHVEVMRFDDKDNPRVLIDVTTVEAA